YRQSGADHSLFTHHQGKSFTIVFIYVDHILLAGNDLEAIFALKDYHALQFHINDLGVVKYFLGVEVARSSSGIFNNQ
ncbi:Retrovirus-related Pol poly from transposon TNT 1-94, partial [Olea europaea subsp. europaea]